MKSPFGGQIGDARLGLAQPVNRLERRYPAVWWAILAQRFGPKYLVRQSRLAKEVLKKWRGLLSRLGRGQVALGLGRGHPSVSCTRHQQRTSCICETALMRPEKVLCQRGVKDNRVFLSVRRPNAERCVGELWNCPGSLTRSRPSGTMVLENSGGCLSCASAARLQVSVGWALAFHLEHAHWEPGE